VITTEQAYTEIVRVLREELMFDADIDRNVPIDRLGIDSKNAANFR
jgi:hypothetical protein